MNKIKIGVIGAGVLGSYHIGKCLANPDVDFCGFYDRDDARRLVVKEKFAVRAYSDTASLLAETGAVIIATPASTHLDIARQCLDRGKHLLIEKPLAASFAEGALLVERAGEKGTVLHVGHSEAFNATFIRLLAYEPRPRFIEVHRLANYSPRGTDVPVVLDLMVHDLQLILRLCREEPRYDKIAATGVPVISDDIDIANVRLLFPSGCVANLTASRISAKRMRKIRVFAKDNYFSADLDKGELDHYFLTSVPVAGQGLPVAFKNEKTAPVDALEAELQAFIDEIKGKKNNAGVTGTEALTVLKVTDFILGQLSAGTLG
jgi:Predicted dehydrogenases and related proteins